MSRIGGRRALSDGRVVTGDGATTGEALIGHPGVDTISFTGSLAVGRHIMEVASRDLKRVTLELGGKSPTIVFDAADLDAAARTAVAGFCQGSGAGCVAGSRILVQESIAEEFRGRLIEEMGRYSAGDPFHPDTQMGPLVSREHYDRVAGYLDLAREEGATARTVGERRPDDLFMPPTLLRDIDPDTRGVREKIFGPVSALMRLHQRGGRHPQGQRHGLRAVGLGVDPRLRAHAAHRRRAARGYRVGEHLRRHEHWARAVWGVQVVRYRPRARHAGARRLHRDQAFYANLAETAEPHHLGGPNHKAWLTRLEHEGDNLWAALR